MSKKNYLPDELKEETRKEWSRSSVEFHSGMLDKQVEHLKRVRKMNRKDYCRRGIKVNLNGKNEIKRDEFERIKEKFGSAFYSIVGRNDKKISELECRRAEIKVGLYKSSDYVNVCLRLKTSFLIHVLSNNGACEVEMDRDYIKFKRLLKRKVEPYFYGMKGDPYAQLQGYLIYDYEFWDKMCEKYPQYITRLMEENAKLIEENNKLRNLYEELEKEIKEFESSNEPIAIIFEERRINIID